VTEIPTIVATLTARGSQLEFYCVHCRCKHFHSLTPGYKSAHCWWSKSPYITSGYNLVLADEVVV
jgi:hypothetical protein